MLSGTTSDVEHLVWPAACLIAFIVFIIAFRKSISNLLSRRLNKLWGVEFGEQSTQQQKELEIRPERTGLENQPQPADPLLGAQIEVLRQELDQSAKEPKQREEMLLRGVAIWQLHHKKRENHAAYFWQPTRASG